MCILLDCIYILHLQCQVNFTVFFGSVIFGLNQRRKHNIFSQQVSISASTGLPFVRCLVYYKPKVKIVRSSNEIEQHEITVLTHTPKTQLHLNALFLKGVHRFLATNIYCPDFPSTSTYSSKQFSCVDHSIIQVPVWRD